MILYTSFSYANAEYTQIGSNNSYFALGNGRFNEQFNAVYGSANTYSALLSAGYGIPLVADLDGDGTNEIIAVDGSTLKVFHNKELTLVNSYTIQTASPYSNFVIFDINGDGKKELIYVRNSAKQIDVLNYSSASGFENLTTMNFSAIVPNYNNGETMVQCGKINECVVVASDRIQANAGTSEIFAFGFNSTAISSTSTVLVSGGVTQTFCLPHIKDIQYKDFNSVGGNDYIFSSVLTKVGTDVLHITYFNINSTLGANLIQDVSRNLFNFGIAAPPLCSDNYGKYISSPLVMDAVTGGQLETIIGYAVSTSEFNMRVYDSAGNSVDVHPLVFNADGEIISNPIKVNAFATNKAGLTDKATDFCIMGQVNSANQIDLLCGSQVSSVNSIDTVEYFFNYSNYNISQAYDTNNNVIHAVKESTLLDDSNNPDEILTPYGIMAFDYSTSSCPSQFVILNNYCIKKIFTSPVDNAAMISVDAENNGLEDLLGLTTTNLYYIDDKFTNSAPTLTHYIINPCLDRTWQLNTTVSVSLTATDPDLNTVAYRIIGYEGDINEQDSGWSANVSSGTTVTLTFKANESIGVGILQLLTTDVNNFAGHQSTTDLTFSVADSGAVFGDCTTDTTPTATTGTGIGTGNQSLTPSATNLVTTGLGEINSFFGIGLIAIWLIIMIIFDVFLISKGKEIFRGFEGRYIFAIISGLDLTWIVLGAIFGVIPFWLILLIIIIGIAVGVVFITNKFQGQAGV